MLEMKMSDKFNSIYNLIELDNKDAIVREVKALRNFTETELASIFGSDSILWILENYTVKELKEKVKKVENSIEIHVGDMITFNQDSNDVTGVILEVTGLQKDRCTALCYYHFGGFFKILEGISAFDVTVKESCGNIELNKVLELLTESTTKMKEGDE